MALQITITDAGRAEIINAQNTGTDPVTIAEIGLGTGQYVPSESQTALVAEFKRLTTFGGSVVAADIISIAIRDDSADVYGVSEFGLYTASGTLLAVYSVVGTPFFDKAAQSILLLAVDIKLTTLDAAAITFGDINFVNPPATESVMGVAELATQAEVQTGTDAERIVTPAGLSSRTATESRTGLIELATSAEVQTGTDTTRAVTPAGLVSRTATELRTGLVELATSVEVAAGTDAERAITPAGLLARTATDARVGLVELATDAEVQTGTDTTRVVTPAGLASRTATEARTGLIELATDAEVQAGTDTSRAVTPAGLASRTATAIRTGLVELATDAEGQTGTDTTRAVTPAVMRADSATANTANRVVRRGAAGQIAVGDIDAEDFSGVSGTFSGPLSVQNFTYSGSLTGSAGVINIGSGQVYKSAAGLVGIGTATPNRNLTVNSATNVSVVQVTNSDTGVNAGDGGYVSQQGIDTFVVNQEIGSLILGTSNVARLNIDPAGNAGLGVTPSAWRAVDTAFQVKSTVVESVNNLTAVFGYNYYRDSSAVNRYINTSFAGQMIVNNGNTGAIVWNTAPSGTAGSPITFTQAMTLTNGGNLLVGTADDSTFRIQSNVSSALGSNALTGQFVRTDGSSNPQIRLSHDDNGSVINATSTGGGVASQLRIQIGNVEAARITAARNLLINTTTDDGVHKLQVNGLASAQTPAQFDNDTSLATSAFVQRALGSNSGVTIVSANRSVSAADAGAYLFSNANNLTYTLPNPSTLPLGTKFRIAQGNLTSGGSINVPGGVTIGNISDGGTVTSISMAQSTEYILTAVSSTAYQVTIIRGAGVGVGQTWQNLTGSRASGTTYTNTSGKAIQVSVTALESTSGAASVSATVGGVAISGTASVASGGTTSRANITFIVPNGATYSVVCAPSLNNWSELR